MTKAEATLTEALIGLVLERDELREIVQRHFGTFGINILKSAEESLCQEYDLRRWDQVMQDD